MENNDFIEQFIQIRPLYKKLATKVALILEELLELNNINFHVVNFRAKTVESFSAKIKNPKYLDPLNNLTDLAGIRIIGYVEDDVKQITRIVENIFDIDPKNSLDKSIELGVDKVGYKSVHYVCTLPESRTCLPEFERFKGLKFEIQIRTILQHSWAEIEHDKNYKFSGELPPEIQRRFKLVAGNLELADREFNQLSKDIDSYSKSIKESTEMGNLDISLNSTALKQFLNTKFEKLVSSGLVRPDFNGTQNESNVLLELRNFGINTLADLDKHIDKTFEQIYLDNGKSDNFLGLVRLIMMSSDINKYFIKSYNNNWGTLADGHDGILSNLGIDLNKVKAFLLKTK